MHKQHAVSRLKQQVLKNEALNGRTSRLDESVYEPGRGRTQLLLAISNSRVAAAQVCRQYMYHAPRALCAHRAGVRGGAELAHSLRDQSLHLPKVCAQHRQDVVLRMQ